TPEAGKKYLSFAGCLQFPFSTGTIHITSTDATVQPAIDPGYFTDDFDLDVLVSTVKFIRKVARTGGFQEMLGSEVDPGTDIQSDSDILEYIKNFGNSEFHTVGSAAMLPREKGGVVSPELKVYGTDNIRVVDLSILPLQISAHPMSTLYGV
ncbi:glucose-methanol-choline oxidoreductase, partial [Rhodocollybia butyracea]